MSATRMDTLKVAGIDVGSSAVKIALVEDTGDERTRMLVGRNPSARIPSRNAGTTAVRSSQYPQSRSAKSLAAAAKGPEGARTYAQILTDHTPQRYSGNSHRWRTEVLAGFKSSFAAEPGDLTG